MWSRPLEDHLTPLLCLAVKSSWPQKWGGWGGLLHLLPHHQQLMNFYLQVFHSFQGQSLLLRCYKVSILDAIPSCVMAYLCAKQGGGFAFCLIPMRLIWSDNTYAWEGYPWARACLSCLNSISFLFILFLFALRRSTSWNQDCREKYQ